MTADRRFRVTPRLLLGFAVLGLGVLFLLNKLLDYDIERVLRFWPVGLIILGSTILWQGGWYGNNSGQRFGQSRVWGAFWILAGAWFLLDQLGWVPFDPWDLFWPLLLLFVGGSIVWRALRGATPRQPGGASRDDSFSAFAVMSGVNLRNASPEFRGGEATAVMGGCEIDLRDARIPSGEAVVDVFALWGGIDVKVPEGWRVVSDVIPLMGGYEDKTRPPVSTEGPRLVLKGFAIMGGVDVAN